MLQDSKMAINILILILSNVALIYCYPKCCDGDNLASSRRLCSDGKPLVHIDHCHTTYILETNDDSTSLKVDSSNSLVVDHDYENTVPENDYCLTTLQEDNREVYIVCHNAPSDSSYVDLPGLINVILQLISVFFIILTVVVYLCIPPLLDVQGINIIHSISGLGIGFIILAILNLSTQQFDPIECHTLAYVLYTSFMYAFFWLNIISFHIWRQVVNPKILVRFKSWKLIYYCYGLGGPLLLLIFLVSVHHADSPHLKHIHPGIAEVTCWFKTSREAAIYLYGPIAVLLVLNVIFFAWTVLVLWKQAATLANRKVIKYRVRLYVKLFFVMGLSWIFESIQGFIDDNAKKMWFWRIMDVINALEGVIIFLVLVVFRKKVIRLLASKKIFRLPQKWQQIYDSECEEREEGVQLKAPNFTEEKDIIITN